MGSMYFKQEALVYHINTIMIKAKKKKITFIIETLWEANESQIAMRNLASDQLDGNIIPIDSVILGCS